MSAEQARARGAIGTGRRRATARSPSGRAGTAAHRRADSGHSLCGARAAQESRLHGDGRADTRHRDRREHRGLHGVQRDGVAAGAGARAAPPDADHAERPRIPHSRIPTTSGTATTTAFLSGLAAMTTNVFSMSGVSAAAPAGDGVAGAAGFRLPRLLAGGSEPVTATVVSGNYFQVLGVRAVVGRTFLPEEDSLAAQPVRGCQLQLLEAAIRGRSRAPRTQPEAERHRT